MNHAAVVSTYSTTALIGIIRQLTISGEWKERRNAEKAELQRRESQDIQQSIISKL